MRSVAHQRDEGRIEMIVRRPVKGQREVLEEGQLTLDEGLAGDCWKNHSPDPDMQINIMNSRAIALVAADRNAGRSQETNSFSIWI